MRILVMASLMLLATVRPTAADIIHFNTSDSQFDAGVDNQGWWSAAFNNVDSNASYFTGEFWRSFFTFDLSSLDLTGQTLVSATLEVVRYGYGGDPSGETIAFFDVSTDAATLNNNTGTSAAIYSDLGTGTSYGSFDVAPYTSSSTETLTFLLNSAALVDIAAAGDFFSIGGSIQTVVPFVSNDALFVGSGSGGVQRLTLETTPTVSAVPEPGSMLLLGTGVVGLLAKTARRRRREASNREK